MDAPSLTPRLVEIAVAYAECCADCEMYRTSDEPPPKPLWQAAWTRRMALQSDLIKHAMRFTDRETQPPESR